MDPSKQVSHTSTLIPCLPVSEFFLSPVSLYFTLCHRSSTPLGLPGASALPLNPACPGWSLRDEPSRKPDDHFLVPAICRQILPSCVPRTCQDGAPSLGLLVRVGVSTAAEALLTAPPPAARHTLLRLVSAFPPPQSLLGAPQENVVNVRALFLFFEEIHSGWVIWGNKMEYFLLKWWRPWFCTVHVSNETETRLEIPTFIQESREFPNSPEVRTWHFHCRGSGLIPGQGTKIPQALPCDQEKKV